MWEPQGVAAFAWRRPSPHPRASLRSPACCRDQSRRTRLSRQRLVPHKSRRRSSARPPHSALSPMWCSSEPRQRRMDNICGLPILQLDVSPRLRLCGFHQNFRTFEGFTLREGTFRNWALDGRRREPVMLRSASCKG